jgi:hypothetical protein
VKRALSGIDAVIQSLGVSAGPEIILTPTRLFSKATQVLVTAMQEARVRRQRFVSLARVQENLWSMGQPCVESTTIPAMFGVVSDLTACTSNSRPVNACTRAIIQMSA